MALLDPNPSNQDLRISKLLPSVKCSSCGEPVPLDQLSDHTCSPASVPSKLVSDSNPSPPPLNPQTAPSPPIPTSSVPMDARFRRRPSTNQQQDGRVYDGARVRNGPNVPSSVPSRGATPSPAPSRNGVRSPGPQPTMPPPSSPSRQAQNPLVRPPSSTRQPIPRLELAPNGISNNISPAIVRPGGLSSLTLDARAPPSHRRPSAPSSPLAQSYSPRDFRDSRSTVMASPPPVNHPVRSAPSPAPSEYPRQPEIDTKSGGAAGMAGVGRRGFAAVARAAMFPTAHPSQLHSPTTPSPVPWAPASFPPQAPQMPYSLPASVASSSLPSHSHDMYSRLSSGIPVQPPSSSSPAPSVTPPPHGREGSATPKPSSIPFPVKPSDPSKPSTSSGPLTPTSPTRPPFPSDRSSQKKASVSGDTIKVVTQDDVDSSFLGHASDDEGSEVGGLAYAQSDESDDEALLARGVEHTSRQLHRSSSVSSTYSDDRAPTENASMENGLDAALAALLRSPTSTDTPLSPESPVSSLSRASKPPMRSLTSVTQRESSSMGGTIARRGGTISGAIGGSSSGSTENGLDTALAALLRSPTSTDTPLSPDSPTLSLPRASKPPMRSLTAVAQRESSSMGGVIARRGGTISGAIGGGSSDNTRKDRSSQESSASGLARHHEKVLTCIRCSKNIEDMRWIRVENGRGVLCDKCWKHMYLPKCRRCNLPIEKQAVSSSDGQLKGKYHRDCFNCHTCHKPFPDKTFYVFDGKPFCDYHYHEANNSLCAAPDCGRPIEGPCAVSHTGDRYHLEHLTCEYEDDEDGKRCDERLVDYWEIEGRMLCERHMRQVAERDMMNVSLDGHGKTSDARAMKRKTRFIDIAGLR